MAADSMVQLVSYLTAQQPYEILGTPESQWVDFKSYSPKGPYDLSTDKGKFELSKDVAAFANASGGLLVCGFKAKKKQNELYEVAEKVTPFGKELVDDDSYKSVLAEYVRPLLKVQFYWYDHPADDPDVSGHYFVIEVPALPDADRWAMVARGITDNGQFIKNSWTIPIRNGDNTAYLPPDEAYRLLNDGLRTRRGPAVAPTPVADRVRSREALRTAVGMEETPVLFFQTVPDHPRGLVTGLYADGGLRDILNNQDTLRDAYAFNWASERNRPEPHEGGLLLADGSRRGLLIESDGAVTGAAAANADMLGWAMEASSVIEPRRISVFVLTEITLEYFRLVDQHVLPLVDSTWTHRIVASDFTRPPARTLAPGDDPSFPLRGAPQPATSDSWNYSWQALGDPERDAYEALSRIYPLFGLDVTANPFVDADRVITAKLLEKK
ncbi:helix-turn-helix domain-containing protein [Streptomyces fulvoviolaceus]|uniref:AlbA family DNA-binding domain-containing protein n=1 Tax=Streptomyces fulvoviolaceus TaxID=285535 RepID=UPI0004C9B7E5|nr:ATP-binding protein [Streptomyces fulvoviolaceus]